MTANHANGANGDLPQGWQSAVAVGSRQLGGLSRGDAKDETMRRCGECGSFCSCGALWPAGLCGSRGKRLVEADAAACVCWEEDWRGVDQSDGEREKCVNALLH